MNQLLKANTPIAGQFPATPEFFRFLSQLQAQTNAGDGDTSDLQNQIKQIALDLGSPDGDVSKIPPQSQGKVTLQAVFPLVMRGLLENGFAQILWQGTTDDVPEGKKSHYYNIPRAWFFG